MAGVVYIPWYATVFRGDRLAAALKEIAPVAFRYGASRYQIHRSVEDRYRFTHLVWFDDKSDWDRYWEGPEMTGFRARISGWYQVPLLYVWHDEVAAGEATAEAAPAAAATADAPAA